MSEEKEIQPSTETTEQNNSVELTQDNTQTEQEKIPVSNQENRTPLDEESAADENSTKNDSVEHKDSEALEEIDDSNAEDAEDIEVSKRHEIPMPEYDEMTMEHLVKELEKLLKNEKIQAIRKHADGIKNSFDQKFQDLIETKKLEFIESGGNELDFRYNSDVKGKFNEVFLDYRNKRNQHYKNLEKSHKENLVYRLELIENLKTLVNVEEDMNATYNTFKDIQAKWRNAGPIPRGDYNNVWKTYHHHIEIFYDFLNINRELRDKDFKHNLEEKTKIVTRAEELAAEPDLNRAFRELQVLHKIWKEDLGPVGKENREEIWNRFSSATKTIHDRRQDYFKNLDKIKDENLENKNAIIEEIKGIAQDVSDNHSTLQQQIKKVEELRQTFFKAGPVPQKQNSKTWNAFKAAVKEFNQSKNIFYKKLKKEQLVNLDKKRTLLQTAIDLKDSEDFDSATSEMKRIQGEWKTIGHVPRKYSDKIWKEFRTACNHYFDRVKSLKNNSLKEEEDNYKQKEAFLEKLKSFKLSGTKEDDLNTIKEYIKEWKTFGRVPFKKKNINQKFDKIIDALFLKLGYSKEESDLLTYGNKIQQLAKDDNQERAIQKERTFIRGKIEEVKNEIIQLENNLQFFSNASESNPLVMDVMQKVEKQKALMNNWTEKLKKLNILRNNIKKEQEEAAAAQAAEAEKAETDASEES